MDYSTVVIESFRILKRQPEGRLLLSDAERATLGEIGHRLGGEVLAEAA